MSWTPLSDKIVTTKKPHLCHGCGKRYSAGNSMQYTTGVNDGDFHSSYWCAPCREFINGPVFSWQDNDDGLDIGGLWGYKEYREIRNKMKPMLTIKNEI